MEKESFNAVQTKLLAMARTIPDDHDMAFWVQTALKLRCNAVVKDLLCGTTTPRSPGRKAAFVTRDSRGTWVRINGRVALAPSTVAAMVEAGIIPPQPESLPDWY